MTGPTWIAAALTLLSIAAQVVALTEVRTWGSRSGQNLARRLRVAWWRITGRHPAMHYGSAGLNLTSTGTLTASGYALPPGLAADLAGYIAGVDARLARLSADAREHAASLADLQVRAEQADALAAEQRADAVLAGGWVITGAVLATLALLVQALG